MFSDHTVQENMTAGNVGRYYRGFWLRDSALRDDVDDDLVRFTVKAASGAVPIATLSGGNQQKVVLARWLALKPKILIVDEPTRGIDVAAKAEVHQLLARLARDGIAVIVISSELPEVLALADRIVTLCEGRLTGEIARSDASEERLMRLMTLRGSAPEHDVSRSDRFSILDA
ncbi:MAG TPA: ATP-binding cassette domain-containing protein [Lichenihabitans sp.]|nr:ATP-binding cassette domain-containing protein [Lichenihabitans sp.]